MSLIHGKLKISVVVNRLSEDRVNPDHALISLTDDDLKDPRTIHEEEASNVFLTAEDMQWAPIRPVLSGFAVSGTTIFLFGGTMREYVLKPVDDVNFVDMEAPIWNKGPSMKTKRWLSKAVAVDDKIYVFGRTEGCEPWAEVYDIEHQKWSDLETPQGLIDAHATADPCCLIDTEISGQRLRKILVYDDVRSRLCSYNLVTDRWDDECGYDVEVKAGVTQLLSSGKLLFLASETEWSVFDLESMRRRGEVWGLDGLLDELRRDDLQICKILSLGCKKPGTHELLICYCVQNCYFLESIEIVDDGERDFNATVRSLGGFRLEEDVYVAHFYAVKTCSDMANGEKWRGHKDDAEKKLLDKKGWDLLRTSDISSKSEARGNTNRDDWPHKLSHESDEGDGETTSLLPPADAKKQKGLFGGSTEPEYEVVNSGPSSGIKMLVSGAQSSYESLLQSDGKTTTAGTWIKENAGVIIVGAVSTVIANVVVGYFLVNKLMN